MAAAAFRQATGTNLVHGFGNDFASQKEFGKLTARLISIGFETNVSVLRKGICGSSQPQLCLVRASTSHSSVLHPILSSSPSNIDDSTKTDNESALILIRHGESMWNEKNLFTGCVDVPLTNKGVEEAIEAGKRISNIPVDIIYTSALVRAQMTAMLALTQHRCKKIWGATGS